VLGESEPPEGDLDDALGRHLRAAQALIGGLADDMAAAGATSASERAQRVQAELAAAEQIAAQIRERGGAAGR
jgi:hypothetical protein